MLLERKATNCRQTTKLGLKCCSTKKVHTYLPKVICDLERDIARFRFRTCAVEHCVGSDGHRRTDSVLRAADGQLKVPIDQWLEGSTNG